MIIKYSINLISIEFLQGLKRAHNDQNNGYYGKQFIAQYRKLTIVIFLFTGFKTGHLFVLKWVSSY